MIRIDFHPSVEKQALDGEAVESLRSGRINPKFLYLTPRQAELWRQVFLRHSPIHGNPEFGKIYQEAFVKVAEQIHAKTVFLVGLGCGTGLKERELQSSLKTHGHDVLFSAIDISRDLVAESAQKLIEAGADHRRSLVCDLTQIEFITSWLDTTATDLPRVITFFGLFPNFIPSDIIRLFSAILRPGDILLASAHLAPIQDENEIQAAMRAVLPQYDNPETLAWLNAVLELWDLQELVYPPEIKISEIEGIPAFVASSRWKTNESFERWGCRFSPDQGIPLRLFYSLRYTPVRFENLLQGKGFDMERLSMTSCRQEALWSIRCRASR